LGKTLVAGAIKITEHGWGRARLATIPDASTDSLQQFVEANIAPGSTVISDGWATYPGAIQGYVHEPLNISASGMQAHESLPAAHRLFSLAKRMIEGTYQGAGTVAHLQEYLDEFVFRFNRRHSRNRGLVFMRLLQRAAVADPVTYRALVREPKPKTIRPSGKAGRRSQPGTPDGVDYRKTMARRVLAEG
jgi:ISXO2-like transposase domain